MNLSVTQKDIRLLEVPQKCGPDSEMGELNQL